jgi:hypothetical protein
VSAASRPDLVLLMGNHQSTFERLWLRSTSFAGSWDLEEAPPPFFVFIPYSQIVQRSPEGESEHGFYPSEVIAA